MLILISSNICLRLTPVVAMKGPGAVIEGGGNRPLVKSAYPSKADQDHLDRLRDRRDEVSFDEHGDGVFSLLQENARLRGLVVTLSTMILKFVVDQKSY